MIVCKDSVCVCGGVRVRARVCVSEYTSVCVCVFERARVCVCLRVYVLCIRTYECVSVRVPVGVFGTTTEPSHCSVTY